VVALTNIAKPDGYRPDIDGLRAISIILVVAYHAIPGLVPGGYVGVDVFFVISGFLITKLILDQVEANSFSLSGFYARRIRRIFPALIVVLLATYAIGWIVLLPAPFSLLGKNIIAGVGFVSNLLQLSATDYFAPAAATNPLLHLWSLGIEEQFYIVWPLLLMSIARRATLRWIIGIAAVSFAANLLLVSQHHEIAFYSPLTRAWELLAGAALASLRQRVSAGQSQGLAEVKAFGGCLLIAVASFALDREAIFPGWNALFPTVGAVAILDGQRSLLSRKLLANAMMVGVGLISYSLYLWHWPLLTYVSLLKDGSPTGTEIVAAVVASFILAILTYKYIEQPTRRRRIAAPKLVLALSGIGLVGLLTVVFDGLAFRFSPEILAIASLEADNPGYRQHCFLNPNETGAFFSESCVEQGPGPLLFIWGDSTAAALYPGLASIERSRHFRIAQFTASGCRPILNFNPPDRPLCTDINETVLGFVRKTKPDVVLLHAAWRDSDDLGSLLGTIDQLRGLAIKRIVLVGPVPLWKRGLPHAVLNHYRFTRRIPDRLGALNSGLDDSMSSFAKSNGIDYFSPWRAFCDDRGCVTRVGANGDFVSRDNIHLSVDASIFLASRIAEGLYPGGSEH
jgi:peptidoglycan/LPS O-acetylase OafA/YrhL